MKFKLFTIALFSFIPALVMAQSAFAGFYGQASTGYESNQLGSLSVTSTLIPFANSDATSSVASQKFGGAPLVLGVGYYWQANEKGLMGFGADYSALTQNSSDITNSASSPAFRSGEAVTYSGRSMQLSNRFNLFLTPAYVIDKDKLVYFKRAIAKYQHNITV